MTERLVGLPFGTAAVEELLRTELLDANVIYRRREIVEALRQRFIELGGDRNTSREQVIVPLKRVLDGPLFVRIRPGFYRYLGPEADDSGSLMVRDAEPASPDWSPDLAGRTPWRSQLDGASTAQEIMAVLRAHGRERIADRIDYLQELAREDPDEQPIAPDSLWHMASFLLEQGRLPDPEVGVSPNALAQVEWTIPDFHGSTHPATGERPALPYASAVGATPFSREGHPRAPGAEGSSDNRARDGLLVMEFLPRGIIGFAALSEPYRQGVDRLTVNGELPPAQALEAVRPFTDRLERT
ncbi:MAG: hypothetical protein OXH52_12875 [Gammaproteobacteria bacterium]|nr:hypothetical protein [Gammaproteobacteria bacterium]